jgi:lysophospholipase L1-like esterase
VASPPANHAYVSLGDSYTSGPFINLNSAGSVPAGCGQSKYSYPYLVASALAVQAFRDPSCGSATTNEFTHPQTVAFGVNPPQDDALGPDTTLVTVGIGGNDAGLVGLATSCINFSAVPLGPPPLGQPCVDRYTAGGVDQYSIRIAAVAPKMATALAEIHRRVPRAKIFVVGYPAVLPEAGSCWPYVPLLAPDVAYVRDKVKELNTMLAAQSLAHGATFVDTWTSSIGHDACQLPGTNWVDGIVPVPLAYPLHPNQAGEANTAAVVARAIAASGWRP